MTEPPAPRPEGTLARFWLRLVAAALVVSAVILEARGLLPGSPVFLLVTAAMIVGLWWFADRGGRRAGPLAGALQALGLLGATLAAVWLFAEMLTRLA